MRKQDKNGLLKALWLTVKIAFIFTIVFVPINQNYTLKRITLTFLVSLMYSFVLGFGQGLVNHYLTLKFDWITQTKQRVWLGIICTILYTIPAVLFLDYILYIKIGGVDKSLFFSNQYIMVHLFYILLSFFISAILHAKSFMQEWKQSAEQEKRQQQIIAKTESAKFETLKTQIDPHFLFNSLNVLTSLISENPNQAEKFTTKLSKVYRYVLEQRNKELVPVAEELQFAKTYIDLLQMRFEDAIQFEISEELHETELKIVPLSLQLLLENAVKHNIVSTSQPLFIKIYKKEDCLVVENNKNVKQILSPKSTKVGLQNIADRYGLISKKQVKINNNKEVFAVELPLLKQVETMETIKNTNVEDRAKEYVKNIKEFYMNLAMYILVCSFLVFINIKNTPDNYWSLYPILGWGLGVLLHGLSTFEVSIFGKNWEQRKIKEYMEKNS